MIPDSQPSEKGSPFQEKRLFQLLLKWALSGDLTLGRDADGIVQNNRTNRWNGYALILNHCRAM
jgi:hypothetical protein